MANDKEVKLDKLPEILAQCNYNSVARIPLRKYPLSPRLFFNEVFIFFRFIAYRRNLFAISLFPKFYETLFQIQNGHLFALYRLFIKNEKVPETSLQYLPLNDLENEGIVKREGNKYWSQFRIVPFNENIYITDPWDRNIPNFVYLSYDSLVFCDLAKEEIKGRRFQRGLDMCCGVGILAIELSPFCDCLLGLDINPKAVDYARMNCEINSISNVAFKDLDVFAFSEEHRYDLIVANPPFLDAATCGVLNPIDSYGGENGFEISLRIIKRAFELLSPGGELHLITRTYFCDKQDQLLTQLRSLLIDNIFFEVNYTYLTTSVENSGLTKRVYRMVYLNMKRGVANRFNIRTRSLWYDWSNFF